MPSPAPPDSRGSRAPGFTMIEILAVLVVLVVVSTVVISRDPDMDKEAYAQAAILKTHLRFAQSLAMAQNTASWGVAFSSGAYILLHNGQPAALPWPNDTSSTHGLPDGVILTAGTPSLFFDEWGSPGETTIVVTLNSHPITITRNTGFIP